MVLGVKHKKALSTNVTDTIAYVSDQIGCTVGRTTFYRWQTYLGLQPPFTPEARLWMSDFARWVRAGSTLEEASGRLQKTYKRYSPVSRQSETTPIVDGAQALNKKVEQVLAQQAQQAQQDLRTLAAGRQQLVNAVSDELAWLISPRNFMDDVMANVHTRTSGAAMTHQPLFAGLTVDVEPIQQQRVQLEESRPTVSDFLAMAPAQDASVPQLEAGEDE